MIHAQMKKRVAVIPPAAIIDDASATTASIDTLGFDYAEVVVHFGAMDIAVIAMKMQEADADSGYADVTGLIFGTSTNSAGSTSTLPSATADDGFYSFFIDLRKRKRFLDLVLTLGNGSLGTYVSAWCDLWRGEDVPCTATARGAAQELMV